MQPVCTQTGIPDPDRVMSDHVWYQAGFQRTGKADVMCNEG